MHSWMRTILHVLLLAVVFTAGAWCGAHLVGTARADLNLDTGSKELTVSRLRVIDDEGNVRVTLDCTGGPSVKLYGPDNRVAAWLRLTEDGPSLTMDSPDHSSVAVLSVADTGQNFAMYRDNVIQGLLGATSHGGYLETHDARNNVTCSLPILTRGKVNPVFTLTADSERFPWMDDPRYELFIRGYGESLYNAALGNDPLYVDGVKAAIVRRVDMKQFNSTYCASYARGVKFVAAQYVKYCEFRDQLGAAAR